MGNPAGAHPAEPVGQGRHADPFEELRASEAVAQSPGAALHQGRLVPDRLPREGHQPPLDGIQLGGVEMSQDLGEHCLRQAFSLEHLAHLQRAHLARQSPGDDGDHQELAPSREEGGGPHLLERPAQRRRDRGPRVGLHEAGVRMRRHAIQRRRPPPVAAPSQDTVDQGPEQPHVKLIGYPLDRGRGDRGDRVGAVAEVRAAHRECDLLHLVGAEAGAEERVPGGVRSRRTRARLAPPKGEGGHRPRREIRSRQLLLHALDTRPAHALGPQQGPDARVAEAARVLLTDAQHDEVRHVLIEVDQEPVLGVQIDQRSSKPWDGREVADRRVGDPLPPPGVGFQGAVPARLDQAGFPGDVLESIGHERYSSAVCCGTADSVSQI